MAHIVEISDLSLPGLDVFARLTEAQLRNRLEPEKGIFIAESLKVIELALKAGCNPVAFLMERRRLEGAAQTIARCGDIPVYTGDRELLAGLTGYELTRGVLCALRRFRLPSAEEIARGARRVAVLDGITDAANVGAIFRSAAALGVDAVFIASSCCDPLCRRSVRVSMGAVFQVPWTCIGDDVSALRGLGFKTAALALTDDAVSIEDPELAAEEKLAMVLGSEGNGLPRATVDACDYAVKIPMARRVDSLNVAAAAAIAFWQLRAQEELS